MPTSQPQRRRKLWIGAALAAALVTGATGLAGAAGFLGGAETRFWDAPGPGTPPLAGVLFSGDMGLRFGMGKHVAARFADAGVPVLGYSSSTAFAMHRTRAEVDRIIADAIRATLARTGAARIIVIGQSFGADMVRVGLVDLPPELRARIAAIVLVVPGETAFFHADPTGIVYRGTPDEGPASAARLDWAPLVCVRGAKESDSLCPGLAGANVTKIVLPGGHFLDNDHKALTDAILAALAPVVPGLPDN